MKLKVFQAHASIPPPIDEREIRLSFWLTVRKLHVTFAATREIHARQRVILESVRLQNLLSERSRRRSRQERAKAPWLDDPFSCAKPAIRMAQ